MGPGVGPQGSEKRMAETEPQAEGQWPVEKTDLQVRTREKPWEVCRTRELGVWWHLSYPRTQHVEAQLTLRV